MRSVGGVDSSDSATRALQDQEVRRLSFDECRAAATVKMNFLLIS